MPTIHFTHLNARCATLTNKYLDPLIEANNEAIRDGNPLPDPDFDDMAAFRVLAHAELESYFENCAKDVMAICEADFKKASSPNVLTSKNSSLILLHLWMQRKDINWPDKGNHSETIDREAFVDLTSQAHGYARQFIKNNNGIKEKSIQNLSAIMGHFPDELDPLLVEELNSYGSLRGTVAHNSWTHFPKTFESPEIEKNRVEKILRLIEKFYES